MKNLTLLFFSALLIFSCKDDDVQSEPTSTFEQEFPIQYSANIEEGKVPMPHHDPTISQTEYEQLKEDLFIINNFGQYQCGDTKETCYFHDGLDFVLKNGTPIFAVEPGIVRSNIGGNEYYRTLVVEDLDEPGKGWAYTHVYFFEVNVGDELERGQFIGRVNFQGLDHIHFSRVRLNDGGSWNNFSDLINVFPDGFFILKDETPPTIESPFLFYENNTDNLFEDGIVDTVSGEVDIVVRMRDGGQYTWGDVGSGNIWGRRLCVKRIEYIIRKDGVELVNRPSFDFTKMEFRYSNDQWKKAAVVFKHHLVADPGHESFNRFLSNYIITNAREDLAGEIELDDAHLAWNTLETNELGEPVFPDGLYEIEVKAWDTNDNFSHEVNEVFVRN